MSNFDQNAASNPDSGVFGLVCSEIESSLVLLPIHWEATCSYGHGTVDAPNHIFAASKFVELYDSELTDFYSLGIAWNHNEKSLKTKSSDTSKTASAIIKNGGVTDNKLLLSKKEIVDQACKEMNSSVEKSVASVLTKKKIVGLVGGDHSVSLGAIKVFAHQKPNVGILQIDAHADLRESFEGLKYSHASIMHNVLVETSVQKIVQVGIRGFCEEEFEKIKKSKGKIKTFFNSDIQQRLHCGTSWDSICTNIATELPDEVYISMDIDGLDMNYCPHTGTPVPGGLSFEQVIHLFRKLLAQNKRIVGFDLVEVACGKTAESSWDAIVAANLLYKMCGYALRSQYKE